MDNLSKLQRETSLDPNFENTAKLYNHYLRIGEKIESVTLDKKLFEEICDVALTFSANMGEFFKECSCDCRNCDRCVGNICWYCDQDLEDWVCDYDCPTKRLERCYNHLYKIKKEIKKKNGH